MGLAPIHGSAPSSLPLAPDVAIAIIGIGALVFAVIAYDMYRHYHA